MASLYTPNPEDLGRRRFPDDKSFRVDLFNRASTLIGSMLDLIPSNYPQNFNTNLAQFFRVLSREFARLQLDMSALSNDKQYTATRIQFLQQILGERLFLHDRLAPAAYNNETFRDYLISLKDAYLKGSTKINMEETASHFTKLPIILKELYLEARKPNSAYDVSDTHKMIVQVLVDDLLRSGRSFEQLKSDLDFFINLIKPAHVLYDTQLIWTEQLDVNKVVDILYGDLGGGCVPIYDTISLGEPTVLALSVTVLASPAGATGQIDSLNPPDLVFYLVDSTKVITESGAYQTIFFNASTGKRIRFSDLQIGQYVKITSLAIEGDWQFWWIPPIPNLGTEQRFWRSTYRRPAFQENVKKVMDVQGRFPLQIKSTPTTICDRWVQDLMVPLYEDLRKPCLDRWDSSRQYSVDLAERMWSPRLSFPWQDTITNPLLYGDPFSFLMPYAPLTDGSGQPATPANVSFLRDGTPLSAMTSVDASAGIISLFSSPAWWDASGGGTPITGNVMSFGYNYLSDGTEYTRSDSFVFGMSYWQMPSVPLADSSGNLAGINDISVFLDGTSLTGAVQAVYPLLGHVVLDASTGYWNTALGRLPQVGDSIDFSYYRGLGGTYSMILDDLERTLDTGGPGSPFTLVLDAAGDSQVNPQPLEIGYRYRTYLLHHSSVLNSTFAPADSTGLHYESLLLNNFQKPALRASLVNHQDSLNHKNLVFSPEFLYDTSSYVLNDPYLENGLDPVLKLGPGTPPFQKTFSYHPRLVEDHKVQDIRRHHNPVIYSDLLLKEFQISGDPDLPLSSICDGDGYTFQIRFGEDLPHLSECAPWIITDTAVTMDVELIIPGDSTTGSPHLRNPDYRLRSNLILRDTTTSGVVQVTYTEWPSRGQTVFQLPETVTREFQPYGWLDFPSLPVMHDASTLASSIDVEAYIDGLRDYDVIQSIDPTTGTIILYAQNDIKISDIVLTEQDLIRGEVELPRNLLSTSIAVSIVHGTSQYVGTDFYVVDNLLIWRDGPLDGAFDAGDILRVTFRADPSEVEFRYLIRNKRHVSVIDPNNSRILDDGYEFPGFCPDTGLTEEVGLVFHEYVNFLDDNGTGIKLKFINKDTYQVEDHVFCGPLFEIYVAAEDQIACPDSFPGALIKIPDRASRGDPLSCPDELDFMSDHLVRFRTKTYRELMPDRSFRTTKLTEMLSL